MNWHKLSQRAALIVTGMSLAFLFIGAPLLNNAADTFDRGTIQLRQKQVVATQSLNQLRDDIAMTRKLSDQAAAEDLERYLLPVDRLQSARLIEQQAASARLQRFSYVLSPEQKHIMETPSSGAQDFAESTLSIDADAAVDGDVFAFLSRLMRTLPGHVRLQEMAIERPKPGAAPEMANNLHVHAVMDWLSNGSFPETARVQ